MRGSARSNPEFLVVVIPCIWAHCRFHDQEERIQLTGAIVSIPNWLRWVNKSRLVGSCSPLCSRVVLDDPGGCLSEEEWLGERTDQSCLTKKDLIRKTRR